MAGAATTTPAAASSGAAAGILEPSEVMEAVRIIVATRDGEPARSDLAETIDGARSWKRGERASVAAFGGRVLSEPPRPALVVMFPRARPRDEMIEPGIRRQLPICILGSGTSPGRQLPYAQAI